MDSSYKLYIQNVEAAQSGMCIKYGMCDTIPLYNIVENKKESDAEKMAKISKYISSGNMINDWSWFRKKICGSIFTVLDVALEETKASSAMLEFLMVKGAKLSSDLNNIRCSFSACRISKAHRDLIKKHLLVSVLVPKDLKEKILYRSI